MASQSSDRRSFVFDTSHPKFRSALVVLVDQISTVVFMTAVPGAISTVILIELIRLPGQFVFSRWLNMPEIIGCLVYFYSLWNDRKDRLWRSFQTPEDYANQDRINPTFREAVWFLSSIPALIFACYILQTYTWLFWDTFWLLCTPFLPRFGAYIAISVALAICAFLLGETRMAAINQAYSLAVNSILMTICYAPHPLLYGIFWLLDLSYDGVEHCRSANAAHTILAARPPQGVLYTHTPLQFPSTQIRLLKLHMGTRGLQCSLVVQPLDTALCYEAISWAWDRKEDQGTRALVIGGRELGISPNMYRIISMLSPLFGTRYVWIDAICIDQTEPDDSEDSDDDEPDQTKAPQKKEGRPSEKEYQIPLMTEVYRNADRVVAFPGAGGFEDLAAEFVGDLALHLNIRLNPTVFPNMDRSDHFPFRDKKDSWKAFFNLVQLRFWTRAWIIQEMVVAKSVVIRYGRSEIPFAVLGSVAMAFKTVDQGITAVLANDREIYNGDLKAGKFGIDFIGRLCYLQAMYHLDPRDVALRMPPQPETSRFPLPEMPRLPDLLVECVQSGATMPHDKVWALCGLINEGDAGWSVKSLQPNYNLSEREVYERVARAVLENERGRRFTLFGIAGANKSKDDGAPSWVPDLSQLPVLYPMDNARGPYTAGVDGDGRCRIDMKENCSEIQVEGLLLGGVHQIDNGNIHIAYGGDESAEERRRYQELMYHDAPPALVNEQMRRMRTWVRAVRQMAKGVNGFGAYSATGQPLDDAVLRTLIGDDDNMTFPSSRETIRDIELFFEFLCDGGIDGPDEMMLNSSAVHRLASLSDVELRLKSQRVNELIGRRTRGRQFAVSTTGLTMLVPNQAKPNDVIVLFRGARVPYLLRPISGKFQLVGEAYVHGVMQGECFKGLYRGSVAQSVFCIV
ncbi:hypothetical protein QBC34DRAFT_440477 [Podospora aff. communis PSN243]|uniref:Heterokaryon incompatibility domain-containing protein n=1 Tax=Podospora aff. communis PSN243 TaxID=3040156 RepID=A0AAV9GEU0_9PEZI|nr:hypothetical protein QBC34DRAFT_440477 [Podospora aff. communis PSN243]